MGVAGGGCRSRGWEGAATTGVAVHGSAMQGGGESVATIGVGGLGEVGAATAMGG